MDCKSGSSCNVAGCFSSTETFLHCKKCSDSDCFVCQLLKKVIKNVSANESITTSEVSVIFVISILCSLYDVEKATISLCRNGIC